MINDDDAKQRRHRGVRSTRAAIYLICFSTIPLSSYYHAKSEPWLILVV